MNAMPTKQPVDLLLFPRWVVPVVPPGVVLEEHALAVEKGRIVALLPRKEARRRFSAKEEEELKTHVLIPGLINLHCHAAMSLFRGMADDVPLGTWLREHIWPAEAKQVCARFVYDGTLLACAQMQRSGITCFNDMYFFPEAASQAAEAAGMRAALGLTVLEFPGAYTRGAEECFAKGLEAYRSLRDKPRLSFCLAPHAPYSVSDLSFQRAASLAKALHLPLHTHLHETREEITQSLKEHGLRPLERLRRLGLLGPRFLAVHAVHLEAQEIAQLAACGASVAHCPTSNLKHGSGIAPLAALLKAGINVGLGTDSAASNTRFDMLEEMRLAALLAKGSSEEAAVVDAHKALEMATLAGARALALEEEVGSLEAGKAADLCAVDLGGWHSLPCRNPVSQLVYGGSSAEVTHLWTEGRAQLKNGKLLNLEEAALKEMAQKQTEAFGCV